MYNPTFEQALINENITDSNLPECVNIGFLNSDTHCYDETQLDPITIDDLWNLWMEFCKENNLNPDTVTYIMEE